MKPILLTPSKAAGLADAYRQFSENLELEGRVAGLTRLECYRLFQTVSLYYKQKGEDLALSFLDKVATGEVALSGELFNAEEHDEKLTKEHNELTDKVEAEQPKTRTLFRSAPARTETPAEQAVEEKPTTRTDEIRVLMEERSRERAEDHLKRLGISEERAKVYSSVVARRLGEVGEETARQKDTAQALVQEVVPELSPEQVSGFSEGFLNTDDTGEKSAIATALASSKFPTPTGPVARPTVGAKPQDRTQRESSQELLLRLGHKERGLFGQIANDFLNQVIPGRRERQDAAARGIAEGALRNFSENNPGEQSIIGGLQEALGHREVLRKIDPSGQAFFFKQDGAPPLAPNYATFEFRLTPGGESAPGNISIRSLGRGMPSPRPSAPSSARSDEGGGSFASGAIQTGMQARDAYKLLGTETGKKVTQATLGRLGAMGARLAASALPAIGGAISAIGGAGMSALAGLGTLATGIAGVAGAVAASATFGWVIAIIIAAVIIGLLIFGFLNISSNQRIYVSQQDPSSAVQSEYIDVAARVSPNSYKGDLPVEVEFTIVVTAKKKGLENVKISETFSVYAKEGNPSPPSISTNSLPTTMDEGASETISYKVTLEPKFKDSIVTNTITVSADVLEGPKNEKTITSASTLLGEVPTGCLAFEGNWTDGDRALELQALGTLLRNTAFASRLCKDNKTIHLIRSYDDVQWGGYAPGGDKIIIYNKGLIDDSNTLYTMTHEAGHLIDQRDPILFRKFVEEKGSEEYLPTYGYGGGLSPGQRLSEDFAENIALFVVWKNKSFACCGKVNYRKDFFRHYKFALETIFGGSEY